MVRTALDGAGLSPLIHGTARDGARFVFALSSRLRQCCVMRNGDPIFTAASDERGIDAAVDLLVRACGAESSQRTTGG